MKTERAKQSHRLKPHDFGPLEFFMNRLLATLIALGLLLAATPAMAADDHPSLAVAPHLGVTAPQPFGDLGSWPLFGVDVGYILPFDLGMEKPLQIGFDVTYTAPGASGQGEHPMLGDDGGTYSWELQQRLLSVQLTTMWRFMPPGQGFSAHALLGPRLYMMETVLAAAGLENEDFGEHRETNQEWGLVFGGGVEYMLGPGAVIGTVLVGGSPLDQRITGEANTAALNLEVGYRFFF